MVTLKQLRRENERLRKVQTKINQMRRMNEERARLIKENKQLAFRTKHPVAVATTQKFVNTTAKFGTKAWSGIQKWGQRLAEAERREQMRQRKLKSMKKRR